MLTQIERLGDGLAVRIPPDIARELGLAVDTSIDVLVEAGRLVVHKHVVPKYTIEWLTEGMTPDDYHKEVDWGPAVGGEVW